MSTQNVKEEMFWITPLVSDKEWALSVKNNYAANVFFLAEEWYFWLYYVMMDGLPFNLFIITHRWSSLIIACIDLRCTLYSAHMDFMYSASTLLL